MENKYFKLSIGVAVIVTAISLMYYLLVRPVMQDRALHSCMQKAEDTYQTREQERLDGLNSVYAERGPREEKIKLLGIELDRLGMKLEAEIRSAEMEREFNDLKEKAAQNRTFGRLSKLFLESRGYTTEDETERIAIQDFKKQNPKYQKIESEIGRLRSETTELNKKDRLLNSEEFLKSSKIDFEKDKELCLKLI